MIVIAGLIQIVCYVLFILILIRVVFSWIGPYSRNPLNVYAIKFTEPILRPVRNLIPMGPGIDFSPMIVSFLLLLVINLAGRL
jgi:YggT family protein